MSTDPTHTCPTSEYTYLSQPSGTGSAFGMPKVRVFETGATRDTDQGKLDYEGFLSPLVIERFAQYMHKHRIQSDGSLRDSDNWTKGIPKSAYMKSLWRHFMDVWKLHRGYKVDVDLDEALCAMLFNVQGYLYEYLKAKEAQ
jgi:hypothetical protein